MSDHGPSTVPPGPTDDVRAWQREVDELTAELAETNRGVVALSLEVEAYREHLEDLVAQRTEELRIATERANAANVAKSAFLANMSHELRTPMNAILGFADLLQTGDTTPAQQADYLDIIARSGEHLLALINEVLDMSKIESGRVEVDLGPVAIRSLVEDVMDLMRDPAGQKALTLELVMADGVPEVVRTDQVKLRQVLLNLVSNAIKNTEAGGVTVTVAPGGSPPPGTPTIRFSVADTGTGIAQADLDRIFEPFQQVGADAPGTGLGLTISKRFAELLGGSLRVESTPGVGSTFEVELPGEESDEVPLRRDHSHRLVVGLETGQHVRALVVEDQPDNALLLQALLEQAGIETQIAHDGADAIVAVDEFSPDIVLMDSRMPVLDGLEATRLIRSRPGGRDLVIIGVTASVFADERATLVAAGMDGVITKPYQASDVYDCLASHLGVRFRYREAGERAEPVGQAAQITSADLAVLSPEVRAELAESVELLATERISAVVERAAAEDARVGAALAALTEALRFEPILNALDGIDPSP